MEAYRAALRQVLPNVLVHASICPASEGQQIAHADMAYRETASDYPHYSRTPYFPAYLAEKVRRCRAQSAKPRGPVARKEQLEAAAPLSTARSSLQTETLQINVPAWSLQDRRVLNVSYSMPLPSPATMRAAGMVDLRTRYEGRRTRRRPGVKMYDVL